MIELKTILQTVENETGLKLKTHRRFRNLVYARYIYYRLAKELTECSLDQIGKIVGKDHSTALNGLNKFEDTVLVVPEWYLVYLRIKQNFQGLSIEEREKIDEKDQLAVLNQKLRNANQKIVELQSFASNSSLLQKISLMSIEEQSVFEEVKLIPHLKMLRKI